MESASYLLGEEAGRARSRQIFALIIYDIIDNKKRTQLAKLLQGYGDRVQRSAFEAHLSQKKYAELLAKLPCFCGEEDSIRVYKIIGEGQIQTWGVHAGVMQEDVILI
ncbi:CRISPR-associated endonuclease Cas2 [Pseudoramibacter faecis]|uniref:CRISPR-associated endonuclease Cas2 n=1 Tax=Pseudoramibacter faecis TaxID=3108534 RepID=UPI002E7862E9|nr:CRISPR-associated endonuclease Cas2 [Pseudoramibacter sp. HA2172]